MYLENHQIRVRKLKVANSRLTEGSYHHFRVIKTIELTERESYFVLRDPLGFKVLMPAWYYTRYGIKKEDDIRCRVDKINCNGRMFLEPVHPHYKEGEIYDFDVVDHGQQENVTGTTENYIVVRDVLDNEWKVRVQSNRLKANSRVRCLLQRIKKGRLWLNVLDDEPDGYALEQGVSYFFTIIDEKINHEDKIRYFIVEDTSGKRHVINKKYYPHYRLRLGQQVRCRVDGITPDGFYFLEPENPWYKQGKHYNFRILELNELHYSDGTIEHVLVVEDPYGEDIKTFIDSTQAEWLKKRKTVNCLVRRIYKSRLELELI